MNPQEACGELGLLSGYCTCLDPNTWSKGYVSGQSFLKRHPFLAEQTRKGPASFDLDEKDHVMKCLTKNPSKASIFYIASHQLKNPSSEVSKRLLAPASAAQRRL